MLIEEYTKVELELLSAFSRWQQAERELSDARESFEGYSFDYFYGDLIQVARDAELEVQKIAKKKAEMILTVTPRNT